MWLSVRQEVEQRSPEILSQNKWTGELTGNLTIQKAKVEEQLKTTLSYRVKSCLN